MRLLKAWLNGLYRIPMRWALLISLPLIVWILFLVLGSLSSYHSSARKRGALDNAVPFSVEIARFFLRDQLNRFRLKIRSPLMPQESALPLVELRISADSLKQLNSQLPASGKSQYYPAFLNWEGRLHRVKARYVGDNYWHWLYPQKSWRIKAGKSQPINGAREFNLKNPKTRIAFNEAIAMDCAWDVGLIAPRVFPVRLILNGRYSGVYLWQDSVDETVLRRRGRRQGSLYSGDGAPPDATTGVSTLWRDQTRWEKAVWKSPDAEMDRGDIRHLIEQVSERSLTNFYGFAKKHLQMDRYATFICLDNIFACGHHDFHHNHKLYFDPESGRVEAVAWDTDDWHLGSTALDCAHSPLLVKWKLIPEFDHLRLKKLYALIIQGPLTVEGILGRIREYDNQIREALEADHLKDFKHPSAVRLLKFKNHPMIVYDMALYSEHLDFYRFGIEKRLGLLIRYLEDSSIRFQISSGSNGVVVTMAPTGTVAAELKALRVEGSFSDLLVYRDRNRNRKLDDSDELLTARRSGTQAVRVALSDLIYPGYRRVGLNPNRSTQLFGLYDYVSAPLPYTYLLKPIAGEILNVELDCINAVTGKPVSAQETPLAKDLFDKNSSLHPWDLPGEPN